MSMSSTVAASETTSCYEQGDTTPVIYDLEKVNSSLVAKQASENYVSDLAAEKTTNDVTKSPKRWAQDVCRSTSSSTRSSYPLTVVRTSLGGHSFFNRNLSLYNIYRAKNPLPHRSAGSQRRHGPHKALETLHILLLMLLVSSSIGHLWPLLQSPSSLYPCGPACISQGVSGSLDFHSHRSWHCRTDHVPFALVSVRCQAKEEEEIAPQGKFSTDSGRADYLLW
jgi:hypothetical protein